MNTGRGRHGYTVGTTHHEVVQHTIGRSRATATINHVSRTAPSTPATVTITGGADVVDVVSNAWALHLELNAQRWSAIVDATDGRWRDNNATRSAMRNLEPGTARHGTEQDRVDASLRTEGSTITYTGAIGELRQAVDTWQRTQLGQFHHAGVDYGNSWQVGEHLAAVRDLYSLDGSWPRGAHASWGIHSSEVGDDARIAYDIWKGLGGGIADRGTITHKVAVHVEVNDD